MPNTRTLTRLYPNRFLPVPCPSLKHAKKKKDEVIESLSLRHHYAVVINYFENSQILSW